MYFGTKSYLKSTCNHTAKHTLKTSLRFTIHGLLWWHAFFVSIWKYSCTHIFKIFNFFYMFWIFLKIKKIILMHFSIKNTLKNNRNYTPEQAVSVT